LLLRHRDPALVICIISGVVGDQVAEAAREDGENRGTVTSPAEPTHTPLGRAPSSSISRFETIPSPGGFHCPGRRLIEAWTDAEIGGAGGRFGQVAGTGPVSAVPMARLSSGAVRAHSPLL